MTLTGKKRQSAITAIKRNSRMIHLINKWNEATDPSVARTEEEHGEMHSIAEVAMVELRANYVFGKDYKELSSGALWPISQ